MTPETTSSSPLPFDAGPVWWVGSVLVLATLAIAAVLLARRRRLSGHTPPATGERSESTPGTEG